MFSHESHVGPLPLGGGTRWTRANAPNLLVELLKVCLRMSALPSPWRRCSEMQKINEDFQKTTEDFQKAGKDNYEADGPLLQ